MEKKEKTFTLAGTEIKVTTGNFGFRSDSAVMLQQGETVVMAFVTVDSQETDLGYFPLGVNYMEKDYAGGIISGSRFQKREGRPSDDAVIKGRIIDRTMRPLFPKEFKRAVSVVINVMSYDEVNDPALLGLNAATMAVHMSSIPFHGPVAAVRIGMDDTEKLVVNPTIEMSGNHKMDAIISCTKEAISQLEIEGDQITEDVMSEAFDMAFKESQNWIKIMDEMRKEVGKEKIEISEKTQESIELFNEIKDKYEKLIHDALFDNDNRNQMLDDVKEKALEEYSENDNVDNSQVLEALEKIQDEIVKETIKSGKRVSGRGLDEIRKIEIQPSFLPRVHGSALFNRGITQALSVTTLGSLRLSQTSENFEGESLKRYMHHYIGPNYSFGSAGRFSFYPGNRELGHGALAEKALKPVLPDEEEFPYAIRVVSEVLSQNGSSSMASTCGSCLALMDAGVPIKAPVAGIAIGLVAFDDDQKEYTLVTDMQDVEDFHGHMDFKVTGTEVGITAIQMDTKLKGVKVEILKDALGKAKKGREHILNLYKKVMPEPKGEVSQYAPKFVKLKIEQSEIGDLIGPGGKNIRGLLESVENKGEVDIQEDGTVVITAVDKEILNTLRDKIEGMFAKPEVGKIYEGTVDKVVAYGAFVDVSPSISGLVHVSEIAEGFVKDVSEHVKEGDTVKVKILGIEPDGKIKFSMKAAQ